jgi:hypothetical protein
MVAIARPSAPTRIQQILLTTAHHFSICTAPEPQLALSDGEFRDPLRFRWADTPQLPVKHPPTTSSVQAGMCPV